MKPKRKSMKERETGYYWVRYGELWIICYWLSDSNVFAKMDLTDIDYLMEDEFNEIDEKQIVHEI